MSGSAYSALPAAAPSFALLSPPILCTAPCCPLHLCLLAPSLPPTHCLSLPTVEHFAGSAAVLGGRDCVVAAAVAVVVANYMRIQII